MAVVVSTILDTTLSSGVLLSSTTTTPGSATLTSTMALWTGSTSSTSTSISQLVLPSVALKINYFTI
jgi:hypothetical protein